jgi:hypothetical protein
LADGTHDFASAAISGFKDFTKVANVEGNLLALFFSLLDFL